MSDLLPYQFGWKTADQQADHEYTVPTIIRLLPDGKLKILDAGCGNEFLSGRLAKLNHEVYGFDISKDGIQIDRNA